MVQLSEPYKCIGTIDNDVIVMILTLVPVVTHDKKSPFVPHFNCFDLMNAVVPLASCNTNANVAIVVPLDHFEEVCFSTDPTHLPISWTLLMWMAGAKVTAILLCVCWCVGKFFSPSSLILLCQSPLFLLSCLILQFVFLWLQLT